MNGQLHAQLNQLNTGEQAPALGGASAPLRWSGGSCEGPEMARAPSGAAATSGGAEPSALVSLLSERHDLQQRLHHAELARAAVEQRAATAEAVLARTLEELESRRQLAATATPLEPGGPGGGSGPWPSCLAREAESLRRELVEAQGSADEAELVLARRYEQLRHHEEVYAEVKVEHDALAAANDELRREVAKVRGQSEAEVRNSQAAEAELNELKAQFRLQEFEIGVQINGAKGRAQNAEAALAECRDALDAAEAQKAAIGGESQDLQTQVAALRSAQVELLEQEASSRREGEREVAELKAKAEELAAERAALTVQLTEVRTSTHQLRVQDEECAKSCEEASKELALERARATDLRHQQEKEAREAEQKVEALVRQLGEERRKNAGLSREIVVANKAAGELTSGGVRRRPKVAASAKVTTGRSSDGWVNTAPLQMQREMELLQKWKGDALTVLRRMQGDMSSAQSQYRQQLEHNQELQEKLERMGHQARSAAAALKKTSEPLPGQASDPAPTDAGQPHLGIGFLTGPDLPERPDMPGGGFAGIGTASAAARRPAAGPPDGSRAAGPPAKRVAGRSASVVGAGRRR